MISNAGLPKPSPRVTHQFRALASRPWPRRRRGRTACHSPSSPRLPRAGAGPAQQELKHLRASRAADGADRRADGVEVEAHVKQLGDEAVRGHVAPGVVGLHGEDVPRPARARCHDHEKISETALNTPRFSTALERDVLAMAREITGAETPTDLALRALRPPTARGWVAGGGGVAGAVEKLLEASRDGEVDAAPIRIAGGGAAAEGTEKNQATTSLWAQRDSSKGRPSPIDFLVGAGPTVVKVIAALEYGPTGTNKKNRDSKKNREQQLLSLFFAHLFFFGSNCFGCLYPTQKSLFRTSFAMPRHAWTCVRA